MTTNLPYATRCLLASLVATAAAMPTFARLDPEIDWSAEWIGVVGGSKPNTWICYRKTIDLAAKPRDAVVRIACDSKYWLWINGELVVFEGQLKRGPTPHDTYFDRVDLAPWLKEGSNVIAVLMWHFGRHGFSHNSSGKAALVFDGVVDGQPLISDDSWKVRVHPAFGTTDPPLDNVRPPESNLRFDARHDIGPWQSPEYDDSDWGPPTLFGAPPVTPWGQLFERPIPLWADSGLVDYVDGPDLPLDGQGDVVVCRLPYNAQVTPYLEVEAPAGKAIAIHTDIYNLYGQIPGVGTHHHEYVTREGRQTFELPAWINGHEVHYVVPAGVRVLDLKYRETGYDTKVAGRFVCNDDRLNQLWRESQRTLYVTMRDTYMDCPDRERAQWWGDAVNELGEAFYVFETEAAPGLTRKAMYELARWQRPDDTLYSPVPSGVRRDGILYPLDGSWDQELPRQMLASVGWYGFWTYYWYTGDLETVRDVYPAVKRYLDLWQLGDDGLAVHRPGGWDWTDWGEHRDVPVIENAWLYLAFKGAAAMADALSLDADAQGYRRRMQRIAGNFDAAFWRDGEYRSPGHQGATDDRANAMAVVAGLADPAHYDAIAEVLSTERHASPYMEKYVLEALLLIDRPDQAFDRMLDRYEFMLSDDKTTLWEFFDPLHLDDVGDIGRGTCNHAWSGGPLTIFSQYVVGVAPTAPAFAEFAVTPRLGRLTSVDASTPTPRGPIDVHMKRDSAGDFQIAVKSPEPCRGVVWLPRPGSSDELRLGDGDLLWQGGAATVEGNRLFVGEHDGRLGWRLQPGAATLTVKSRAHEEDANALSVDERQRGFVALFDGRSLDGWSHAGNWSVVDGSIHRTGDGGFLTYDRQTMPDDFELRFQWKVAPGANSGVFYRPGQYEYQILDNAGHSDGANPRTSAASLYFGVAPSHDAARPALEWNDGRIVCHGTVIQHWLNGQKVVHVDYADPCWRADVDRLSQLGADLDARGGRLSLQDHGDPVWYRAIRMLPLPPDAVLDDSPVEPAPMTAEALQKEDRILRSILSR